MKRRVEDVSAERGAQLLPGQIGESSLQVKPRDLNISTIMGTTLSEVLLPQIIVKLSVVVSHPLEALQYSSSNIYGAMLVSICIFRETG